jgi:hypothetical protein
MSTLKTFRFWFEPDDQFPMFKQLAWELVEVSIRDVLMGGIHPWTTNHDSTDVHPSLIDAFVQRLNSERAKIAELDGFGYCYDVSAQQGYYYEKKTRFERTLEYVQKNVQFVDDLSYPQLLQIAKRRLRDVWDHRTARTLAEQAHPGFQELRQFLKAKNKSIKLSGYDDIEQYDLGQVLALEDFDGRDSLLIAEAIPSLNFRRTAFLGNVTDGQGKLRLVPDIRKVTLTMIPEGSDYVHLVWHVERDGETCKFRPEIGKSDSKRRKAREFAEKWRTDQGRLCFSTSMARLSEMVEGRIVLPSFPTLNYTFDHKGPAASAQVPDSRVPAYFIGGFYDRKSNGDTLKEILREYGVSMTGNKAKLLQKLAKLAARQYAERRPQMDAFFSEYRFVRINATPPRSERLPLLEDEPLLRNLILTMYAMKHLRGNAILDVAHDNNTYTEEQLAHALLIGKVGFSGAFLRVA